MPRISSTSGAPDLTVEPKLLPEDIKNMTDEQLEEAIEKLRGDRSLYVARAAGEPRPRATAVERSKSYAKTKVL